MCKSGIWFGLCVAAAVAPAQVKAQSPVGKPIGRVVIQNNRLQRAEHIVARLNDLREGRRYTDQRAKADIDRLMATRWFRDVRVNTLMEGGRVTVFLWVEEVPAVVGEVVYRGAENYSPEELNELTGLRRGTPMNPLTNEAARTAIVRKYHEDARVWAQVRLIEGNKDGDRRVVFDITEGPRVRIKAIEFQGNASIPSGRLSTVVSASSAFLGLMGGLYRPGQAEFDLSSLREYYRDLGFHDADVSRELRWSADYSRVTVIYHIREGARYFIRDVKIQGNKAANADRLMTLVKAKGGEPYDRKVTRADMKRIQFHYGSQGQQVQVAEKVYQHGTAPGEVNVVYQVRERPPARVGRVIIAGNRFTRDNVIRRQIPLRPGQVLNYPALQVAEANLARLGIFRADQAVRPRVTVIDPESDSPFKDVLVEVEEIPTGSLLLGANVNTDAGLTGTLTVTQRNFDILRLPRSFDDILSGGAFRGGGQTFRIQASPGTQFQSYLFDFREPFLFDTPYSLGVGGYYFTRSYLEFNENRLGGRVTTGRQFNRLWSGSLAARVERVDIFDVPFFAPPEIRDDAGEDLLVGLKLGFRRDSRDSFLRPTSGSVLSASFEQVLGDNDFQLGVVEYQNFLTVYQRIDGSGKHVLSFRSQAQFASNDTPVYERFYAGGFRSLRGFEFRGVGPFVNGLNVGGTFSFLNSLEYQVPILANDRLFLAAFVDSGAVESEVGFTDYRVSAGVGLRVKLPAFGPLPLAFDFGFPIVEGPNDRNQVFSFWLGFNNRQ